MGCERNLDRLLSSLLGELDGEDARRFERHLAACAPCRLERDRMLGIWERLGTELPAAPDRAALDARFERMVEAYAAGVRTSARVPARMARVRRAFQVAAALAVGLALGVAAHRPAPDVPAIADLTAEIRALRQELLTTSLQLDSTFGRLRAVQHAQEMEVLDPAARRALLDALRHDPSVSVRLDRKSVV